MEHRWHTRQPVEVDVFIYRHSLPLGIGRTCDLSREGVYLRSATDLPGVQSGQSLEVGIPSRKGGFCRWVRIPAEVRHRARDGLGLMFVTYDDEKLQVIESLLADESVRARAPLADARSSHRVAAQR